MKPLSKGDTVKVRLHTGEVVEAVYDRRIFERDRYVNNEHFVQVHGEDYLATDKFYDSSCVRFVGNPCALVPVGVSV